MAQLSARSIVMRGFMPRIYPLVRPNGVSAPQRVAPRVEPEGDNPTVMRALDARIHTPRRPNGVSAPERVAPRVEHKGDAWRVGS